MLLVRLSSIAFVLCLLSRACFVCLCLHVIVSMYLCLLFAYANVRACASGVCMRVSVALFHACMCVSVLIFFPLRMCFIFVNVFVLVLTCWCSLVFVCVFVRFSILVFCVFGYFRV